MRLGLKENGVRGSARITTAKSAAQLCGPAPMLVDTIGGTERVSRAIRMLTRIRLISAPRCHASRFTRGKSCNDLIMEISRTRPPDEVGRPLIAGQPTPSSMTSRASYARSQGDEKLVQLLELLACPTCAPRGDCIVESFF